MYLNIKPYLFMFTNLGAKLAAAFGQIYAIAIFTRVHSAEDAALIFLRFGYAIWFQIFDFGFSQTIQNRFNRRSSQLSDLYNLAVMHLVILFLIASFVLIENDTVKFLLPEARQSARLLNAFVIGVALLLMAVNNMLLLRLLLVLNKGTYGNILLLLQSLIFCFFVSLYGWVGVANLTVAVLVCFTPPLLIFFPLVLKLVKKIKKKRFVKFEELKLFLVEAKSYWFISVLSLLFIGSDYIFVSHFLENNEVLSYHLATRSFFISFAAYYAYAQYQARHYTTQIFSEKIKVMLGAMASSVLIGLFSVFLVYFSVIIGKEIGLTDYIFKDGLIDITMFNFALLYYLTRVFRDVGLLIMWNLGLRKDLLRVYFIELAIGFLLLALLFQPIDAQAIFISLTIACAVSFLLITRVISRLVFSN